MATEDKFADRIRPAAKSGLLAMLDDSDVLTRETTAPPLSPATPLPNAAGFGELTLLPRAGDPYVAHSRQANGAETTLYCIDRHGMFEGFAWNTFDRLRLVKPEKPGSGPVLVVRFYGSEITEVSIEGRNLESLHVFLGQCRLTWIRELGEEKAFGLGPNDPVITRLMIQPVER